MRPWTNSQARPQGVPDMRDALSNPPQLSPVQEAGRKALQQAFSKGARAGFQRGFTSAQVSRLTHSWTTMPAHINQDLFRERRILVARSRDLRHNNDYGKRFIGMVRDNVIGAHGMRLKVEALRDDGTRDEPDSVACEAWFKQFSKLGNFDVTGKLSRRDFEALWIETLATDGETLVRRVIGRGKFGYQLQMLDPLLIDDSYNVDLGDGIKIRMGVEFDAWRAVRALHLLPETVNDIHGAGVMWASGNRVRIPIEECWHDFITEQANQLRGLPWMTTAGMALNMLGGFEEGAVVNARAGAAKMGFFQPTEDAPQPDPLKTDGTPHEPAAALADGVDADGFITEAEPGTFGVIPFGYEFKEYDPQYPHEMYASFVKACLRRVSAGLPGSTYTALSGDSEAVNYSSGRIDLIREREVWKSLQQFVIERLTSRVYSEALPYALLGGHIKGANGKPLPFSKLAKYDSATWQGVRWPWVDMEKEIKAQNAAVEGGLASRASFIRERGDDPEQVWRELEEEDRRLVKPGVISKQTAPAPAGASTSNDGKGAKPGEQS